MARLSKTDKGRLKVVDDDVGLADLVRSADQVDSAQDGEDVLDQVDPLNKFLLVTPDRFILVDLEDGEVLTQPYSALGGYSDRLGKDNGLCMEWTDNQLFSVVYRTSWQFKYIRKNWHTRFTVGAVLFALNVLDLNVAKAKIYVAVVGSQSDAARAISVLSGGKAANENTVLLPHIHGVPDFIVSMTGQASFQHVSLDDDVCLLSENFAATSVAVDKSNPEILNAEQVKTLEVVSMLLSQKMVGEACEFELSVDVTADEISALSSAAVEAGTDLHYADRKVKLIPRINLEKFAVNTAKKLRQ